MNTVSLIIAAWVGLGTLGIWFLVCLFTVANLHYRDEKTWHARFILMPRNLIAQATSASSTPKLPRDKCSYFRSMFLWTFVRWILLAVIITAILGLYAITTSFKLIRDWIVYPVFTGKYVLLFHELGDRNADPLPWKTAVGAYLSTGFGLSEERYAIDGKIPFTRTPPVVWISLSALLYETVIHWRDVSQSVFGIIPQALSVIAVFTLIFLVVKNKQKIGATIERARHRVCWELPDPPRETIE